MSHDSETSAGFYLPTYTYLGQKIKVFKHRCIELALCGSVDKRTISVRNNCNIEDIFGFKKQKTKKSRHFYD